MKKIEDIKILVVGDIMLDKYVEGTVSRISPEAPVPVVEVINEYTTLGGSGNVLRNIRELGAQVDCLASIAQDFHGKDISEKLDKLGVGNFLFFGSTKTTVKERIIAEHRKIQMLRVDREYTKSIKSDDVIKQFKDKCSNDYDMIIVSDYAKGMISYEVMQFLKQEHDAKIIVDPKPINSNMYNGVFMITPNDNEWKEMMFASAYNLKDVKFILATKGKEGMLLIDNIKEESWKIDAEPVPVYNVSGAGDVVVAMMAVCLSHELNVLDSAYIANKCAGYAVTQPQTCVVPKDKFKKIYENYFQGNV